MCVDSLFMETASATISVRSTSFVWYRQSWLTSRRGFHSICTSTDLFPSTLRLGASAFRWTLMFVSFGSEMHFNRHDLHTDAPLSLSLLNVSTSTELRAPPHPPPCHTHIHTCVRMYAHMHTHTELHANTQAHEERTCACTGISFVYLEYVVFPASAAETKEDSAKITACTRLFGEVSVAGTKHHINQKHHFCIDNLLFISEAEGKVTLPCQHQVLC